MAEPTIKILPDHLANQIAAGEVVQRPESVVKELVENAVDAGATSITVVVREAGKQLIHVIDDGKGMSREDLELATVRHATSKISSEQDLHAIKTLGFRGEALASIAAVADVEIRSRRAGDEVATTLISRPGVTHEVKSTSGDVGTQILVRNLFYNVPARRKFLKSDMTEFRHISEAMQRMALARPDLRFTFYDGDQLVFDVKPAELKRRIQEILNLPSAKPLVHVEGGDRDISVEGYVGLPSLARQSRSGQFFFLNGRPISSRSLSHAVVSAYEHLLDAGQHPVFVLHVTIDPQRVDVNVHPQKHEVKFDDERTVYLLIQHEVTKALQSQDVIPSFLGDVPLSERPLQSLPRSENAPPTVVNRLTGEIQTGTSPAASRPAFPSRPYEPRQVTGAERRALDTLFGQDESTDVGDVLHVGRQYILSTSADGVVVIDQHAAHERVLYERSMKRTSTDRAEQALLFAVEIRLSSSHVAVLKEYLDELTELGFRLEIREGSVVEIHAVPSDVQPGNEQGTLDALLQSLEDAGRLPRERRREGVAAAFASRQALRRGEPLSPSQMRSLVADLFACSVPHLTPHGEPTYIVIPFDELAQRFR